MRILFCNYEYPPLGGGGGVINALLAEEMAKQHDVTVLTSRGLGLPPSSIENGVEVIRVPTLFRHQESVASLGSMLSFVVSGISEGRKLLRQKRFDLINTHFVLPSGPVGHVLSQAGQVPNVLSLHGGDLYDPSKFLSPHRHLIFRLTIRYLLRRADKIIGQSENTLTNMRTYYTPDIQGERIPLAIRRPSIERCMRTEYKFKTDDILLITVGRLIGRKRVQQLIKLLTKLRRDHIPARLIVVGSGPQEATLSTLAAANQVSDYVHLMGFVTEQEKFGLLEMSDIYVSASQHEGFGLVFLEGMSCGLPILCYDHGGQNDFLSQGQTGYVVPLDDTDLFEKQCRHLIANPQLRRRIGEFNQRYVEQFYIETCAQRHEQLFDQVVKVTRRQRKATNFPQPSAIGSD